MELFFSLLSARDLEDMQNVVLACYEDLLLEKLFMRADYVRRRFNLSDLYDYDSLFRGRGIKKFDGDVLDYVREHHTRM